MKRNKDKEKKEYEKISATESLSYTKAEVDAKINALTSDISGIKDEFVLDELVKYAINNDTSTTAESDLSSSTALKVCSDLTDLSTLSLNSRRNRV